MRRRARGFSLLELVMGMAVIGILSMTVATFFKAMVRSWRSNLMQAEALRNVRIAYNGTGAFKGMVFDTLDASSVTAVGVSSLSFVSGGVTTTYRVRANGNLQVTKGAVSTDRARSFASLSFAYYGIDANGLIYSTTVPADAKFVTMTAQLTRKPNNLMFYSGSRIGKKVP